MTTHAQHHTVNITAVGDHDFEEKILKSPQLTVVDFWFEGCPPCHALAPVYQKLSQEYAGRLKFASMDIETHMMVPSALHIQGAPTLAFFRDGREVARLVGPHPRRLKDLIEGVLAQHG